MQGDAKRPPDDAPEHAPDAAMAEWLELACEGDAPDPGRFARERGLPESAFAARAGMAQWLVGRHHAARSTPGDALPALPFRVGEFTVLEPAGRGAMGVVFRALQDGLERHVAVKVLDPVLDDGGRSRLRFLQEARAAARLAHPNVVSVIAVGEQDGHAWYAMEWIEGESLASLLARRRSEQRTPDRDWCRESAALVAKIAHALQHAHDHGLLHRDVKPGNILVDERGEPHLADFGLVKDATAATMTHSGDVVGSPAYMSPEQLRGDRSLDARSDVYSLGVTLYECLTLARPFEAASVDRLARRIASEAPVPPRRLVPVIEDPLQRVCLRAIAAEPGARYASAAAFAVDLEAFLRGEPVAARGESVGVRLRRLARRRMREGFAVTAIVVVLGLLWLVQSSRSELHANERRLADKELVDARLFGDEDGYRERLGRALADYPDDGELHLLAAVLALEEGDVAQAEHELRAAAAARDQDPVVTRVCAAIGPALAFVRAGTLDDDQSTAVDSLADATTTQDGRELLLRGQVMLLLGRPDDAERLFERARFVAPELSRHAALGLCRCWTGRGEHERARDMLELFVTEASPASAFYRLVSLSWTAGDPVRAADAARRLRSYHPASGFNAVARLIELRAEARANGVDTALLASIDDLGARAAASPDWAGTVEPIWRAALGTVLLEHGHPARAATVFRDLVAAHPDRINARALLGIALCTSGERERGVAELEAVAKACDDRPGERDARWATYHFHRKDFDLAIEHGKESLRRYPADPARWHAFGEAWAEKAMTATKHSLRATALEEARKAFVREIELAKRPEPSTLLALLRTLAILEMTYEFRSGVTDPDAVRVAEQRRELERDHEALRTSHAAGVARIDAEIVAYRQTQQRFLDERKKRDGK